jgi:hypothetical protein
MHRLFHSMLLCSIFLAATAWAAAPATGVVFEGDSVPGIALGDSRALVEATIGAPDFCQSTETGGDRGSCNFPVDGGGTVSVRYRGADGGNPGNSPTDVVHSIRWYEAVNGWVTTAGVSTGLAADDPDAVLDAYPDAEITYTNFGGLYSAIDYAQGIAVFWVPNFYTGQVNVNMQVYSPLPPPPPEELTTRVTDIELTAVKHRGRRTVRALVQVRNQDELAASGATVVATWTRPDGSTLKVSDGTSSSGYAFFELSSVPRGVYSITIDDVILEDHDFDADGSVLSDSVYAK